MQDDENKRNYLMSYSVKLTLWGAAAIVFLGVSIALFDNNIFITWIFAIIWMVLMFFILRGIYLMWFK